MWSSKYFRTIATMGNLSRWWCCEDGCTLLLLIRNMMLRLSLKCMCQNEWQLILNECQNVCEIFIFFMAINMLFSSTQRMFWSHGSLNEI